MSNQSSERTGHTSRKVFGRVAFEMRPFAIGTPTAFETRPRETVSRPRMPPPFAHVSCGLPRYYYTYTRESQIYRQHRLLERSESSCDLRPVKVNHRFHIGVMPLAKPPERVEVHPLRLGQNIGRLRESHPRPA